MSWFVLGLLAGTGLGAVIHWLYAHAAEPFDLDTQFIESRPSQPWTEPPECPTTEPMKETHDTRRST